MTMLCSPIHLNKTKSYLNVHVSLKGQFPDYALARASSVFLQKTIELSYWLELDRELDHDADGDVLFIFSNNISESWRFYR